MSQYLVKMTNPIALALCTGFLYLLPIMKKPALHLGLIALGLALLVSGCAKESNHIPGGPDQELERCVRLSSKKKYEEAIRCLEILKAQYPQSQAGREAELKVGDAYYNQKEYALAAEAYAGFLKLYPHERRADYAHYRAGVSYFRQSPKAIDRDQTGLEDAMTHLTTVVRDYPKSAYAGLANRFLRETRNRVARRHYYVGRFYYRTGEYIASLPRFREVAEKYPEFRLAPKALYMMTVANIKLGQLEEAKGTFGLLTLNYPKNRWTTKAEKRLRKAGRLATHAKEK